MAPKIVKIPFFCLLATPKSISRKIQSIGKFFNFYTVWNYTFFMLDVVVLMSVAPISWSLTDTSVWFYPEPHSTYWNDKKIIHWWSWLYMRKRGTFEGCNTLKVPLTGLEISVARLTKYSVCSYFTLQRLQNSKHKFSSHGKCSQMDM